MRHTKLRKAFTLVELLVVIAIIGILIGMLLPAVQSVREAARRIDCGNKMRQLALAFHNFESAQMHFPSGLLTASPATSTNVKMRGFGWGTLVLPQVEQQAQYDLLGQISNNFTSPAVEGTINGTAVDFRKTILDTFICPSCPLDNLNPIQGINGSSRPNDTGKSNFVAIYGSQQRGDYTFAEVESNTPTNGISYVNSKTKIGEIIDGTTNTFLLGERDGGAVGNVTRYASLWIGANEGVFLNVNMGVADVTPYGLNSTSQATGPLQRALGSQHTGGANFAYGDASVHFLSDSINPTTYQGFGTRAGGEVVAIQ